MSEPTAAAPARAYRAGLDRGELRYQRCDACLRTVFPPRVLCPECGAQELSWERSAGRGTVYAATVVRARDGARGVVLVDLDEGFRMMSRVDGTDPADVPIGTTVRFTTADEGGEPVAVFVKEAR
ncbi:DNA-binding protein [Streptomyces sp. Ru73]|uniref:Zn-ribbon domain-containing OB-fold protein n=1 Tax=Streptomyces sp. Ru73 TaxID=2080748 RepID=UPI000CDE0C23|nr:OB-fold domain-containing protein [Streptomyces sp. Ru73]POX42584.1 DNA-binding protein [Streptomyces sp. Ru73]